MADITQIREKLRAGKASIGTWQQIPDSDISEMLADAGYDWVAVDLEHGGMSRHQLSNMFRAMELKGAAPMARVANADMVNIKTALEAGAHGVILPMITSREQLDAAVNHILYPPAGARGVGFCRANLYGRNFDEYMRGAAERILIVAQIEHIDAVNNLEAIIGHPRLDAVFVGPYDLSGSMNLTAQFDHPGFKEAMEHINTVCRRHGMPMGAHVVMPDAEKLRNNIEQGYQFIAYGIDSVFLRVAAELPRLG